MRTTIIIDDVLEERLKSEVPPRRLSAFINRCLHEYFVRRERAERFKTLEQAYQRAAHETAADFATIDTEDWPEW